MIATTFINTRSSYIGFGPGAYTLESLKLMTPTVNFLEMPAETRGCQIEAMEKCQLKKFLERGLQDCGCVPWEFAGVVHNADIFFASIFI